jgi:hypothetical protein
MSGPAIPAFSILGVWGSNSDLGFEVVSEGSMTYQ